MLSWPWLKDLNEAIADTIEPVDEYDKRLAVKELIEEYRSKIDKVKEELSNDCDVKDLFDKESKHDDLWILRFLISHGDKMKPSIKAAKTALLFRHQHDLDQHDIRFYGLSKSHKLNFNNSSSSSTHGNIPILESVQKLLRNVDNGAMIYGIPDLKRGVVGMIHLKALDRQKLDAALDDKDRMNSFLYLSEWTFQWLDYVTRTTGRLTRSVRIVDMEGIQLANMKQHRANRRHDGKKMTQFMDCYPQLLGAIYICNAPNWLRTSFNAFRVVMPSRVASKINFITPKTVIQEREKLFEYISQQNLPKRFGGDDNEQQQLEEGPSSIITNTTASTNTTIVNSTVQEG